MFGRFFCSMDIWATRKRSQECKSGRNAANTSGIISRGVLGSSTSLGTFGAGILQQPMMMQVVVAPEPGTLVALSFGALLLRRRRKS